MWEEYKWPIKISIDSVIPKTNYSFKLIPNVYCLLLYAISYGQWPRWWIIFGQLQPFLYWKKCYVLLRSNTNTISSIALYAITSHIILYEMASIKYIDYEKNMIFILGLPGIARPMRNIIFHTMTSMFLNEWF